MFVLYGEKQKTRMYHIHPRTKNIRGTTSVIPERWGIPSRGQTAPQSCNGTNRRRLLRKRLGASARERDLLYPLYRLTPPADSLKARRVKNNSFIAFLCCWVLYHIPVRLSRVFFEFFLRSRSLVLPRGASAPSSPPPPQTARSKRQRVNAKDESPTPPRKSP